MNHQKFRNQLLPEQLKQLDNCHAYNEALAAGDDCKAEEIASRELFGEVPTRTEGKRLRRKLARIHREKEEWDELFPKIK
jgi:hypothetical protein